MRLLFLLFFALSLTASPLHEAVRKLDQKEIDRVLISGVDINAVDENGETALHIAARIGRYAVVKQLLAYKPDLSIVNKEGYTPLAIAIHYNYVKSIQVMVKAQKTNAFDEKLPLFHQAVVDNNTKQIKKLLREGVSVELLDSKGRTPIQIAAREGNLKIVHLLLHHGSNLYHVDNEGRDTLYFARYGKNEQIIQLVQKEIEKRGRK